jgi:O-antigen ligase
MRLARALSESEAKKVQTFVLLSGVFTTLTIWTKLEDPINLPKMFVLVLFAAIALGLAMPALLSARHISSNNQKISLGLIGLFALGLMISTIATDVKYTAIFGEYHRNNGFLSYFAMIILMVAGSLVFNFESAGRFFNFLSMTGLLLTLYGILQGIGKDPVGWKILYNPFITTLGNPNFTSAFLGISAIAIFYLTLTAKNRKVQMAYTFCLIADLYILRRSESVQGVFGFAIGVTIIILVKLWMVNRKYGFFGLLIIGFLSAPVLLAVLNIGPLASKFYQETIRNRMDYWTASIEMFKDHPITGIGIDRFGEFYRQYAPQNQIVQGQITDNAHSVYVQMLATGGLLLIIPYILLILFITFIGFVSLIKSPNENRLLISAVFAIWLAILAMNIVTIDNLGTGVWFWITGGVLIAVSKRLESISNLQREIKTKTNFNKSNTFKSSEVTFPATYALSLFASILVLILMIPALVHSSNVYNLQKNAALYSRQNYVASLVSESKNSINPQHLIQLVNLALTNNAPNEALVMIERINSLDSRSFYGNYFAAISLEALNKRSEAIIYRERLKLLDPWNNANLIELIKSYLAIGNRAAAAEIAALIKLNYPGSQSDIDASALLIG